MDQFAKQFLLTEIVGYAKLFQSKRNRNRLTANDIHDAIHALGYQPLFSGLGINGDEIVQLPVEETSSDRTDMEQVQVHVQVRDVSEWIPSIISGDNFRPRKIPIRIDAQSMKLTERTKQYIRRVIDSVNDGESPMRYARNQSDVLVASWFLGLHFSDTVSNQTGAGVNWVFARQCLWFLDHAIETHKNMRGTENLRVVDTDRDSIQFPEYLSGTWMIGLEAIAKGQVGLTGCESQSQVRLMQKICDSYIQKFIKQ
jgi:hypothetical protein